MKNYVQKHDQATYTLSSGTLNPPRRINTFIGWVLIKYIQALVLKATSIYKNSHDLFIRHQSQKNATLTHNSL